VFIAIEYLVYAWKRWMIQATKHGSIESNFISRFASRVNHLFEDKKMHLVTLISDEIDGP
jgi:hypothetical protein